MSDGPPEHLTPRGRVDAIRETDAFYELNTYTSLEVEELIFEVLYQTDLDEGHISFLFALARAFAGYHPKMRANIELLIEGKKTRELASLNKELFAHSIADKIDMQVARGTKQEAAIQEAISEFGVSRREVFRMLKIVRKFRISIREGKYRYSDWSKRFEGFEISDDGSLVPRNPNT